MAPFDFLAEPRFFNTMNKVLLATVITLLNCTLAQADWVHEKIRYELDGVEFRGHLIYEVKSNIGRTRMGHENLPCIFMVPNWMGPDTEATLTKAKEIADEGFAVFVADIYGTAVRPENAKEAGAAAGFVRSDRELMRTRTDNAVQVFKALAHEHPLDSDRMVGIGFCFGGGTLLEYARSGRKTLKGIISFHGDLASPTLKSDAAKINIPLLVLHGADDPYVPQTDVQTFIQALQAGSVRDWQLVQFSGAVHSFTDPTADSEGARYHKRTAERAFEMMEDFAEEVLEMED